MEQNSNETNAPIDGATPAAVEQEAVAAAPVRRRSRRATAATGEAVAAPESVSAAEAPAAAPAAGDAQAAAVMPVEAEAPAPKKRATRSRKKAVEQPAGEAAEPESGAAGTESAAGAAPEAAEAETEPAPKRRATRSRKKQPEAEAVGEPQESDAAPGPAEAALAEAPHAGEAAESPARDEAENAPARTGNQRGQANQRSRSRNGQARRTLESAEAEEAEKFEPAEKTTGEASASRNGEGAVRSSRTRQRERKRRGQGDDLEPEITEDDVLLPIAGVLDVLDNYAFVRTSGYLPGTNDVYVSLGQVKKYGLRKGDAVVGAIRQPRDTEAAGRQKYNAIVRVDTVNSRPVPDEQARIDFSELTPVNPDQRLRLETGADAHTQRVIDLFAPIGFGQRGLVLGGIGAGKTEILRQTATAVAQNHPEAHLMFVLLDARPEEATELQRSINGEVIAATFDRPAEDQATVAELAVERAKRLVELGHDVVVLLDSITALGRAQHLASPAAARLATAGIDPVVLAPVKRLLSAARNLENGGSLTILATANAHSTSQIDELILEELAGVWNMQVRLNDGLAAQRRFPAIDLVASGTRHAELLSSEADTAAIDRMRRDDSEGGAAQALAAVLSQLAETASNAELLARLRREPARA